MLFGNLKHRWDEGGRLRDASSKRGVSDPGQAAAYHMDEGEESLVENRDANHAVWLRTLELALPPGTRMSRGARESALTPGEWDETTLVVAAWGALGGARQDAPASLCCPVPGIHQHPPISWPEEVPYHFGKPLQRGHCKCCLAALNLAATWVSGDQQPPPALQPGLAFPPSQSFSPSCTLD